MHPYTQALMSAVPVPDPRRESHRERILLTGDLPSPINPPSGCVFHTRCPKYREQLGEADKERCRSEVPAFEIKRSGHLAACHFAEINVDVTASAEVPVPASTTGFQRPAPADATPASDPSMLPPPTQDPPA
jgi:oligopeptide/dipeptide ABC transporter ATP-binding protein